MHCLLAYADSSDSTSANMTVVFGGLGIIAGTAFLAFVLILTARARRHPYAELIMAATVFWAILTAGSLLYAGNAQLNWSREYAARLETGYLDPQNTTGEPRLPWGLWAGLSAVYTGMMGWTLISRAPTRR